MLPYSYNSNYQIMQTMDAVVVHAEMIHDARIIHLTMTRSPGPIYEYACHEGNYSLANLLRGYRASEREAANPAVR